MIAVWMWVVGIPVAICCDQIYVSKLSSYERAQIGGWDDSILVGMLWPIALAIMAFDSLSEETT